MITLICLLCRKEFNVKPVYKDIAKYCSHSCYSHSLKGKKPKWYYDDEQRIIVGQKISSSAKIGYASGRKRIFAGKVMSIETRQKISDAQKGRIVPDYRKKMISDSVKKLWQDKSYADNMRRAHLGISPINKGIKGDDYKRIFLKGNDLPQTIRLDESHIQSIVTMYVNEKLSTYKIAKILGINQNKIVRLLRDQNIRAISPRENVLRQLANGAFPRSGTKIEVMIITALENRGYIRNKNFFPQYNFENKFSIDIAFPDRKLAIECQGDYWHANPNKYSENNLNSTQKRNLFFDKIRVDDLNRAGWKLLEFWETDIKNNVNMCLDKIENYLKN